MKKALLLACFLTMLMLLPARHAFACPGGVPCNQDPGGGGGEGGCRTCVTYLEPPNYRLVMDCEPPVPYDDGFAECHATYTEEDGWNCWVEGFPTCQWT